LTQELHVFSCVYVLQQSQHTIHARTHEAVTYTHARHGLLRTLALRWQLQKFHAMHAYKRVAVAQTPLIPELQAFSCACAL
jgi:hypothetical protein